MRRSSVTVLTALSILASGASAEAALPSQAGQIAACMQRAAASLKFSGTAYARRADLVVERSFGASDAAGEVPNSGRTRFNFGSANKMFVAIAMGRLVDRGLVQFDPPIGRCLPDLKPEFADITIGQLLDHTSGLGDYFRPQNQAATEAAKTATDLLPLALASPPAFQPGSRRAYSNSGFIVLGAVIEKPSSKSCPARPGRPSSRMKSWIPSASPTRGSMPRAAPRR